MRTIYLCVCIAACSSSSSNKKSDDGSGSLEAALAAGVSLGQTSSLAMQAMATSTTCASVTTACPSFPCNDGAVTVDYGGGCPLPLGGTVSGTVKVTGSWQSADSATLSDTFVGVAAGDQTSVVVNAKNLRVSKSADQVTVSYSWQDVSVQSGTATLGAQSSWTTTIDLAGTPGDPSDDIYTVAGVDQGVSTTVSQLSLSNVVVKPTCTLNPVSGTGVIQKVALPSIVNATVSFHDACDGKAEMNGASISLDFLN